jgi:hypothetical protein
VQHWTFAWKVIVSSEVNTKLAQFSFGPVPNAFLGGSFLVFVNVAKYDSRNSSPNDEMTADDRYG